MPNFLKGLTLSRRFFTEIIAPHMDAAFPALPYAAGLVGPGSDVQGFDTPISSDHDWGPRLTVFLPDDRASCAARVKESIDAALPETFLGWPVFYGTAPDGVSTSDSALGDIHSLVRVTTSGQWIEASLGLKALPPTKGQWIKMADQQLREVTGGEVFCDAPGQLSAARAALAYYPEDIWLYRLYCLWSELSEEAQFTGRTGDLGDEYGSRILASRQARRLMRLAFYYERVYAPYSKWFGTAFCHLSIAGAMREGLDLLLTSGDWRARVKGQGLAIDALMDVHDALGITPMVPRDPAPYRQQFLTRDLAPLAKALYGRLPTSLQSIPPLGGLSDFLDRTSGNWGCEGIALRDWLNF